MPKTLDHTCHLSNELQTLCNANWSVQLSSTAEVTGKTCDCWSQQISGNDAPSQGLNMPSLRFFSVCFPLFPFRCGPNCAVAVRENCSPVFFSLLMPPFCTVNSWSHDFGYGRSPVRLCPFYWSWTRTGQRPAGGWAKTTLFPITLTVPLIFSFYSEETSAF